jgi:hypothetical protein
MIMRQLLWVLLEGIFIVVGILGHPWAFGIVLAILVAKTEVLGWLASRRTVMIMRRNDQRLPK